MVASNAVMLNSRSYWAAKAAAVEERLAKSKSANTQGNPWHHDETGRFTSADSGSSLPDTLEALVEAGYTDATPDEIVERYGLFVPDSKPLLESGAVVASTADGGAYLLLNGDGGGETEVTQEGSFYDFAWDLDTSSQEADAFKCWQEDTARSIVFHGTPSNNLDSIRADGLTRTNKTRGVGNRGVGPAVFTSTDDMLAESYSGGSGTVIRVDLPRALADGAVSIDSLRREPGYNRADALSGIAWEFDEPDFDPYDEFAGTGMDPATVIVIQDIPPRYLSLDGEPVDGDGDGKVLDGTNQEQLAKSKSANTQGNPWHSDESGQFTSAQNDETSSDFDAADTHEVELLLENDFGLYNRIQEHLQLRGPVSGEQLNSMYMQFRVGGWPGDAWVDWEALAQRTNEYHAEENGLVNWSSGLNASLLDSPATAAAVPSVDSSLASQYETKAGVLVDHTDPSIPLSNYNSHTARQVAEELFNATITTPNGTVIKAVVESATFEAMHHTIVYVDGRVTMDDGSRFVRDVGSFSRELRPQDGVVKMDYFALDPDIQGHGIGTSLVRHWEDQFARAGFSEMQVHAVSNGRLNGAYTWMHQGYEFPDDGGGEANKLWSSYASTHVSIDGARHSAGFSASELDTAVASSRSPIELREIATQIWGSRDFDQYLKSEGAFPSYVEWNGVKQVRPLANKTMLPRDGDGDGRVLDGTDQEQAASTSVDKSNNVYWRVKALHLRRRLAKASFDRDQRYKTYQWQQLRLKVLAGNGQCQMKNEGCTGKATTVNHKQSPHSGGSFYGRSNLQAACSHCNSTDGGKTSPSKNPKPKTKDLAKSKSANTQGNPWHSDENGQFTSTQEDGKLASVGGDGKSASTRLIAAERERRAGMRSDLMNASDEDLRERLIDELIAQGRATGSRIEAARSGSTAAVRETLRGLLNEKMDRNFSDSMAEVEAKANFNTISDYLMQTDGLDAAEVQARITSQTRDWGGPPRYSTPEAYLASWARAINSADLSDNSDARDGRLAPTNAELDSNSGSLDQAIVQVADFDAQLARLARALDASSTVQPPSGLTSSSPPSYAENAITYALDAADDAGSTNSHDRHKWRSVIAAVRGDENLSGHDMKQLAADAGVTGYGLDDHDVQSTVNWDRVASTVRSPDFNFDDAAHAAAQSAASAKQWRSLSDGLELVSQTVYETKGGTLVDRSAPTIMAGEVTQANSEQAAMELFNATIVTPQGDIVRASVTNASHSSFNGATRVVGQIHVIDGTTGDKEYAGRFSRELRPHNSSVYMSLFTLESAFQRKGLGSSLVRHWEDQFARAGYKTMEVSATSNAYMNGAYTWMKQGYDFSNNHDALGLWASYTSYHHKTTPKLKSGTQPHDLWTRAEVSHAANPVELREIADRVWGSDDFDEFLKQGGNNRSLAWHGTKKVQRVAGKSTPRDGDGDGKIFDGTDKEQQALDLGKSAGTYWQAKAYSVRQRLAKFNSNHDELGRFATADESGVPWNAASEGERRRRNPIYAAWQDILHPDTVADLNPRDAHPENYGPTRTLPNGGHVKGRLLDGKTETHREAGPNGGYQLYDIEHLPKGEKLSDRKLVTGYGLAMVRVEGSERPGKYVYRMMAEAEYQQAQQRGYFQSDQSMNLSDEGTVFSADSTGMFYYPSTGPARIVRFRNDPTIMGGDGYDSYIKTGPSNPPVPIELVDAVSPLLPSRAELDKAKVAKANPYHDELGRFTRAGNAHSIVGLPEKSKGSSGHLAALVHMGGTTFDAKTKTFRDSGYAVAVADSAEAEFSMADWEDHGPQLIERYLKDNAGVLARPAAHLGGWVDTDTNTVYLDASAVMFSSAEAADMSRAADQIAFFDLATFVEWRRDKPGPDGKYYPWLEDEGRLDRSVVGKKAKRGVVYAAVSQLGSAAANRAFADAISASR